MKIRISTIATLFAIVTNLLLQPAHLSLAQSLPPGDDAKVTQIVSGDTINVTINNIGFTLGLIGLDAPNVVSKTTVAECFASQSLVFAQKLLRGKTMRVVRDSTDFDANGRLMRYVYLQDGRLLNEVLLQEGYARAANVSPDVQLQARLQTAEQTAQSAKRGLWRTCAQHTAELISTSTPPASGVVVSDPSQACPSFNAQDVVKKGPRSILLVSLPDNACVKLTSNGGAGIYRWHPAGSRIRGDRNLLGSWQDGVVSIWRHKDGYWVATGFKIQYQYVPLGALQGRGEGDERLTPMGDNYQFLGMESTRTFFLQDAGSGDFITLIDAFQLESGDYFKPKFSAARDAYLEYYDRSEWVVSPP